MGDEKRRFLAVRLHGLVKEATILLLEAADHDPVRAIGLLEVMLADGSIRHPMQMAALVPKNPPKEDTHDDR